MGLKTRLDKLRRDIRGNLGSFLLADGTRHYFNPEASHAVLFRYFTDSMRADHRREPRPEPPELLKAVANARDREAALSQVMGKNKLLPVSREDLVRRGQFIPHTLRASDRQGEEAG